MRSRDSDNQPTPSADRNPQGPLRILAGLLLDALMPCRCLHCAKIEPGSMPLGLCSSCRRAAAGIRRGHRPTCQICGQDLPDTRRAPNPTETGRSHRCLACRKRRSPLDGLYAGWHYRAPIDDVVRALKFSGLPYLGTHLGRELAEHLPPHLAIDALVPIPLHWRRSWRRGYNQAAEIAAGVSAKRGWPIETLLKRRRATPAQSGLEGARRRRNLHGAFAVNTGWLRWRRWLRSPWPSGQPARPARRILLVDDVYTTGATAESAAGVLKSAGATWVAVAVAARTPEPAERRQDRPTHINKEAMLGFLT